jgi:hypothetical protein
MSAVPSRRDFSWTSSNARNRGIPARARAACAGFDLRFFAHHVDGALELVGGAEEERTVHLEHHHAAGNATAADTVFFVLFAQHVVEDARMGDFDIRLMKSSEASTTPTWIATVRSTSTVMRNVGEHHDRVAPRALEDAEHQVQFAHAMRGDDENPGQRGMGTSAAHLPRRAG